MAIVHYFRSRTDSPEVIHFQPTPEQRDFYGAAFAFREARYEQVARQAAEIFNIAGEVRNFVAQYGLANAHVLEVGAGAGCLQDLAEDYTGLDISPTAWRQFRKPFVQADARAMPFRDGEFDAIWSVWVLNMCRIRHKP